MVYYWIKLQFLGEKGYLIRTVSLCACACIVSLNEPTYRVELEFFGGKGGVLDIVTIYWRKNSGEDVCRQKRVRGSLCDR